MRPAIFLCCLTIGVSSFVHASRAEDITVDSAFFAGGIREKDPLHPLKGDARAAPGPLWFWVKVRASEGMAQALKEDGRLPLEFVWYENYAGDVPGPDEQPDFTRELELIDTQKAASLAGEAQSNHSRTFTYRTASCRSDLPEGNWLAFVRDAQGTPLDCTGKSKSCVKRVLVMNGGKKSIDPCIP